MSWYHSMLMWLYPCKRCPHHPPLLTFELSLTESHLQSCITTLSSHNRERWRPWGHSNVGTRCSKHVYDLISYHYQSPKPYHNHLISRGSLTTHNHEHDIMVVVHSAEVSALYPRIVISSSASD
jgi:hypothetical protein